MLGRRTRGSWVPRRDVSFPAVAGSRAEPAAPTENGFSVIYSQQIASDDSKFFTCVLKSGGTVPQSKKWVYQQITSMFAQILQIPIASLVSPLLRSFGENPYSCSGGKQRW